MKIMSFSGQTGFYQGKVRDVYTLHNKWLVMIASNRISAFDVILPKTIPYKGQVLNQIAAFMLKSTQQICPNWLIDVPAPTASIGYKCTPLKMEVVVRGNLVGHAWRTYQTGKRTLCGAAMPNHLKENDYFPQPIITPSTKADAGHDQDISPKELIDNGICTSSEWEQICGYAIALFEAGRKMAKERGLILADTKYEFGKLNGEIMLMDEVHTPDSSRYFYLNGFEERQQQAQKQTQLSKEFVREWLMENHFMGRPGEVVPEMTDAWVETISRKYIELYEKITGLHFEPAKWSDADTENAVNRSLEKILT